MMNFVMVSTRKGGAPSKPRLSDTDINFICHGDSVMAGNGVIPDQYYTKEIRDYLAINAKSVVFNSFGVNGQSTLEMLANIDIVLDLIDPTKYNVVLASEDINAILNDGRTAQQNYNDFSNYCTQCKDAGCETVMLATNYYPRVPYNKTSWSDGNPSPLDRQHEYYGLTQAQKPLGVDILLDYRNAPLVGGGREQAVTADFNDSVHLETTGADELATYVINYGFLHIFDL